MAYSGNASQRLASVQSAIDQIISGGAQSYSIRGRAVQRAELRMLRELEKELMSEASLEAQGQMASVGIQVPAR